MPTNIHQEIVFETSVERVYAAITQSEQFAEFTGKTATISNDAGGEFCMFDGMISGRHIELVPNQRIVQAWRVGDWPDGVFSVVRFDLSSFDGRTQVVFEQKGHPEEAHDHLGLGWHKMYWEPLRNFLA